MWRWYDSAPSQPRVVLCDGGGRLVKSPSGGVLFGYASAQGVAQISIESSPTAEALGESWGISPLSIVSRGGIYLIDGFEFSSAELQSLRAKRSEFEVFDGGYSRPFGSADSYYVVDFGVAVGFDGTRRFGSPSVEYSELRVETPDETAPEDAFFVSLWVDFISDDFTDPFARGSHYDCVYEGGSPLTVPNGAVVSFGELVDVFPS